MYMNKNIPIMLNGRSLIFTDRSKNFISHGEFLEKTTNYKFNSMSIEHPKVEKFC